jgi:hypothetical protein
MKKRKERNERDIERERAQIGEMGFAYTRTKERQRIILLTFLD